MASNPTPDDQDTLLALAEDMADGLDTHEVTAGVKQNTAVVMRAAIAAVVATEAAFGQRKKEKADAARDVVTADKAGAEFIKKASNVLKNFLGSRWNTAWEPTGFPGNSTGVPSTQAKRFTLLKSLKTYFTSHAPQESPNQGVTAALADAAFLALSNARDTLGQCETNQNEDKKARDAALKVLRGRVRGLIEELAKLLGTDDPRWDAFGLSRPSDPDTPLPASELTATPAGPGLVNLAWKRGKRATRYRIFIKVLTVDTDPRQLDVAHDLHYPAEGLPGGKTAEFYVIAANDAADAAATATVSVAIP